MYKCIFWAYALFPTGITSYGENAAFTLTFSAVFFYFKLQSDPYCRLDPSCWSKIVHLLTNICFSLSSFCSLSLPPFFLSLLLFLSLPPSSFPFSPSPISLSLSLLVMRDKCKMSIISSLQFAESTWGKYMQKNKSELTNSLNSY